MVNLAENVCHSVVIHEVPGIKKCYPLPSESESDTSVILSKKCLSIDIDCVIREILELKELT